jgi:LmbE family N-acetylglucosaminyl deacetylase
MKQIQTPADISQLGAILSIWAHPDDESYLAAGVLAQAIQNGQRVACVTATKGEKGSQDFKRWPPDKLGEIRADEMAKALKVLGITQHYWLGCHDGACASFPKETAMETLVDIVRQFKPDTIITFGPDGWTGHPDHCTISKWVSAVVTKLDADIAVYHVVGTPQQYEQYLKAVDEKINVFFNIDKPPLVEPKNCDILFVLPVKARTLKQHALAVMPSQTETLRTSFSPEFLDEAFATEAFVQAQ